MISIPPPPFLLATDMPRKDGNSYPVGSKRDDCHDVPRCAPHGPGTGRERHGGWRAGALEAGLGGRSEQRGVVSGALDWPRVPGGNHGGQLESVGLVGGWGGLCAPNTLAGDAA